MDFTLKEWVNMAGKGSIAAAAVQMQAHESGMTVEEVREVMLHHLHCMQEAVKNGLDATLRSVSGLSGGQAAVLMQRLQQGKSLCGNLLGKAEVYALATAECNACMGKIVAAPTAGACGVLPAVLLPYGEKYGLKDDALIRALYISAGFGAVIAQRASISGAEAGCQAEIGSASAMAAASLVYLHGGDNEQMANAVAIALKNMMGLVCDPVAGLVEVPCVKRNVAGAMNALSAAELALAGIVSRVPVDEVIDAMRAVGEALPSSLRETGRGGIAASPSAVAFREKFFGKNQI